MFTLNFVIAETKANDNPYGPKDELPSIDVADEIRKKWDL
jgi:hypothetical protein